MSSTLPFVHLHVHTHYSLLDGATRIGDLIARAKAWNMPAVAITDHGNMFGVIEFYLAARKAGIRPIIGCELYLTHDHTRAGESRRDEGNGEIGRSDTGRKEKEAFHLLVLAQNRIGYQNLMRLSTLGFLEGFYRKPRIDKAQLREFSEGLICTSTCLGGEIPQALVADRRREAEALAETYLGIFGPERFFIEIQDHGIAEQRLINPELIDLAQRLGIGVIATNDVHYLDHSDVEAHDVLCCINTGANVADAERFRFATDQFYFKSAEEMARLFPDRPEAISNTNRIAETCDLEIEFNERHAPVFRVPDAIKDEEGRTLSDADYLRQLAYGGARERYGAITGELRERLDYELEVITSKGFASYFLIVWDFVNYARQRNIPVGARGSGCSSLVSYCLRISQPDPVRYGLYFERFMDPDRDEMPDIDVDMCQDARAEVIDYVRQKYGHVAQIITFGTLKAKAAIKDVARVMGVDFARANELTKLVPSDLRMTVDKALKQEPDLQSLYQRDPQIRKVVDIAKKIEGLARNAGVHAAGVVIADKPMTAFLPLHKSVKQDAVTTQFDGPTVEKIGLLKMDLLGLRTLSVLEKARRLAEQRTGKHVDLEKIDLADRRVYRFFERGDTMGVFQFESGGMRDVLRRMKPNRIEDLIAANALYRPGPMEYIDAYIARKHGEAWSTPHPIMTDVLQETYGIMVYQEQVSRLVNRLGGIELKSAFRLAKAISKKKTDMIEAMRGPFVAGCAKNGVSGGTAQRIFEDILKFGGYAFNKAHSTGYALVAYQTAYLKTYFPVQFMAALLSYEMNDTDKVAEYREACERMGITIEPPNINRSGYSFTADEVVDGTSTADAPSAEPLKRGGADRPAHVGRIRFGLGAIKGLGQKAIHAIMDAREDGGRFTDLLDFCERLPAGYLTRAGVEALICAGAFDDTGHMRRALFESVEETLAAGQSAQRDKQAGQFLMFHAGPDSAAAASDKKPDLKEDEWNEAEMLAREKAVLGFYATKHPLVSHKALVESCGTASVVDLQRIEDRREVILGGMATATRSIVTRQGRNAGAKLVILTFEDLTGRIEAVIPGELAATHRALLAADSVLFLKGQVNRQREEPSLRVQGIIAPNEVAAKLATGLALSIRDEPMLPRIQAILSAYRGLTPVYLELDVGKRERIVLACGPRWRISPCPELLGELADGLGTEAVRLIGPEPRRLPIPWRRAAEWKPPSTGHLGPTPAKAEKTAAMNGPTASSAMEPALFSLAV